MKITIRLYESVPLRNVHQILAKASSGMGVSMSSVLDDAAKTKGVSAGYDISNFSKIETMRNPSLRMLYTVIVIGRLLGVEIWLTPVVGVDPIKVS